MSAAKQEAIVLSSDEDDAIFAKPLTRKRNNHIEPQETRKKRKVVAKTAGSSTVSGHSGRSTDATVRSNILLRRLSSEMKCKRIEFVKSRYDLFEPYLAPSVLKKFERVRHLKPPPSSAFLMQKPNRDWLLQEVQPKGLTNITLRPYQLEGVHWMLQLHDNGLGGILADEMGLGKTIQTIAFLRQLSEEGFHHPHLIVVPLNVLNNWHKELSNFCPFFRVCVFHGSEKMRNDQKIKTIRPRLFDILLTSYEMVVAEKHLFRRAITFGYVILDEGHRIKNGESARATELMGVSSVGRIILTGTPVMNNCVELYQLLSFLNPDLFPTNQAVGILKEAFDLNNNSVLPEEILRLREMLKLLLIRRIKTDVTVEIPPKTEIIVKIPLTRFQIEWYRSILKEKNDFEVETNKKVDYKKLTQIFTQLRKVCNHPFLLEDGEDIWTEVNKNNVNENHTESLINSSAKMMVLDKLLLKLFAAKEEKNKVLIFSQWVMMVDVLEEYCQMRNFKYLRLDGSTSRTQRSFDTEYFQADPTISIYLISTRAGGIGINLTAANHVILYDSDWNPQLDQQAQDRAHRIGQTRQVNVYRLVTEGTMEERIVLRAEKKLYLDAVVLAKDPDENIKIREGKDDREEKVHRLLSAIRFGCRCIARSAPALDPSNVDIDTILSRAEKEKNRMDKKQLNSCQKDLSIDEEESNSGDENQISALEYDPTTEFIDSRYFQGEVIKKTKTAESSMIRHDKRSRTSTTMQVGTDRVLLENNYELNSFLGRPKDINYAKYATKKAVRVPHYEDFCFQCKRGGLLVLCQFCPRVYCLPCLGVKEPPRGSFTCAQHKCTTCNISKVEAGGCLFTCSVCPDAFCYDHLPTREVIRPQWRNKELEMLEFRSKGQVWIQCSLECQEYYDESC